MSDLFPLDDIEAWCDAHLPDLYDEGMFDHEDAAEEVWEGVESLSAETILAFVEDEDTRDALSDAIHDAAAIWFRQHHDLQIAALCPVPDTVIDALMTKPQVDQHSAEWYDQRRNRLTASEFSQILGGRRGALLRSKVEPAEAYERSSRAPVAIAQPDGEMNATSWGHRFEPVVRRIFEEEVAGTGTVCDTMGRITHHSIPWLSASPDGIVMRGALAGRLVEIKAPKTRQPGEFVPDDYYVQMQIQMEVTDTEAVEFLEAKFAQRPLVFGVDAVQQETVSLTAEEETALNAADWKGYVEVYGEVDAPETWRYRYSEPVNDLGDAMYRDDMPVDLPLIERTVWWLVEWHPRTVLRNRAWWSAVGWPAAELFWTEVTSAREAFDTHSADTIEHVCDVQFR